MTEASAYQIPTGLSRAILAGRCVAFVGAGFSAAGGLPSWQGLLERILADAGGPALPVEYLRERIANGTAHALDEAAQALEDAIGRDAFIEALHRHLRIAGIPEPMRRRAAWLQGIPFRAVLTTNFDGFLQGLVPDRAAYRGALRPEGHRWWERRYWVQGAEGPLTVKLHGDLERAAAEGNVVITRRDYRRRLYADPAYGTFLRGMLATATVLYLGFSFEDAYLNELRSEVLALVGHEAGDEAIAYAVMNDVAAPAVAHYRRHEGIEILTYATGGGQDFSGFDRWLEQIHDVTNPVARFGRHLRDHRILWLDPHPQNNAEAFEFFELAAGRGGYGVERVGDVDAALARLVAPGGGSWDLLITHWGEGRARREDGTPVAAAIGLLESLRRGDIRVPVVVFAGERDADQRKVEALSLGAADYCFTFAALFRRVEAVFAPASVTG